MLSYRKSQQVLLAEKLKMKNVIHVFGVSGSGTTMARLCLSAFARVATIHPSATDTATCFFATAHSCGLRRCRRDLRYHGHLCHSAFVRVATQTFHLSARIRDFATAHSCGLRPASHLKAGITRFFATAHSCGLRRHESSAFAAISSLPQRIRAGCDERTACDGR